MKALVVQEGTFCRPLNAGLRVLAEFEDCSLDLPKTNLTEFDDSFGAHPAFI